MDRFEPSANEQSASKKPTGRFLEAKRSWVALGLTVTLLWFPFRAQGNDPNLPLESVIANVRSNEKLYEDIEIILRIRYERVTEGLPLPGVFTEYEEHLRSVLQDDGKLGLIYTAFTHSGKTAGGKSTSDWSLSGFDGTTTKKVISSGIVNIHEGRFETSDIIRPHALLLDYIHVTCPLSVWLTGGEELRKHPGSPFSDRDVDHQVTVQGVENVQGLECVKLRGDLWKDGFGKGKKEHLGYRIYWICPERNYLPVKIQGYLANWRENAHLPIEFGYSTDFRQIKPGIWFPFLTKFTVHNLELSTPEKLVPEVVKTYIVEKAELDPNYPISLFRDIPIPEGAIVYELKNNEIVRSYEYNSLEGPQSGQGYNSPFWRWLAFAGGLVLIVLLYLVTRRWPRAKSGSTMPSPML